MSWMIDNLGTIVVGLLLAAVVTAITIRLIKNKKAGNQILPLCMLKYKT